MKWFFLPLIFAFIGFFIGGGDGVLFFGLLSLFIVLIIKFLFSLRCSNCGKWVSFKKVDTNYYQCNKCNHKQAILIVDQI